LAHIVLATDGEWRAIASDVNLAGYACPPELTCSVKLRPECGVCPVLRCNPGRVTEF